MDVLVGSQPPKSIFCPIGPSRYGQSRTNGDSLVRDASSEGKGYTYLRCIDRNSYATHAPD